MKQTKIETRKQIILPVIEQTDMKKINCHIGKDDLYESNNDNAVSREAD